MTKIGCTNNMKVKEEFCNIETLGKYGFNEWLVYPEQNLAKFSTEWKWGAKVEIQTITHSIYLVCDNDFEEYPIPDVIYKMIADGIVEI